MNPIGQQQSVLSPEQMKKMAVEQMQGLVPQPNSPGVDVTAPVLPAIAQIALHLGELSQSLHNIQVSLGVLSGEEDCPQPEPATLRDYVHLLARRLESCELKVSSIGETLVG